MWSRVSITTPAALLPLEAADLRRRLRIHPTGDAAEDAAEDALLQGFLRAALREIDGPRGIGCAVMAQTWTLTLPEFAPEITLPGAPVRGVSALRYVAPDGASQALNEAEWRLDLSGDRAVLTPARGTTWPATLSDRAAVSIEYDLGAESAADAEPDLVTAAAMLAGHFYEHREAVIEGAAVEIPLGPARIMARHRRGAAG